jgi:biopolymer transport protein ExbD
MSKQKRRTSVGESGLPSVAGVEESAMNADINMTPMIDVMLVLLIIFMIITPVLASYALVLPPADQAQPERDDRVIVSIDQQGRYFIMERPQVVPEESLVAALRQEYALRPEDFVLYLKADQGVPFSLVLTAIDAAREVGVARVGAITERQMGLEPLNRR